MADRLLLYSWWCNDGSLVTSIAPARLENRTSLERLDVSISSASVDPDTADTSALFKVLEECDISAPVVALSLQWASGAVPYPDNEPMVVPAAVLDASKAFGFLTNLPRKLEAEVGYSDTTKFWLSSTRFLLHLLMRGRVVPGTRRIGPSLHAYWFPSWAGEDDARRFEVLAVGMPQLLPSVFRPDSPYSSPHETLESFLIEGANALVREFLARFPLTPPITTGGTQRSFLIASWLSALSGESSRIVTAGLDGQFLEDALRPWVEKTGIERDLTKTPVRFVLEPSPEGTCRLRFELRAIGASGPSSLWHGGPLNEKFQLHILRSLWRAQELVPVVRGSLDSPFPEAVTLSQSDAAAFLSTGVETLRGAGFEVEVNVSFLPLEEALWIEIDAEPAEPPATGDTNSGRPSLGVDQMLNVRWQIRLGNAMLSPADLLALSKEEAGLRRIGDQWVLHDPSRTKALVDSLANHGLGAAELPLLQLLRLQAGIESESVKFNRISVTGSDWVHTLLSADRRQLALVDPPTTLQGTLRPYQHEGLSWLAFLDSLGLGACLADDMGLGKTVQFLSLLLSEQGSQPRRGPTLLVVPLSVTFHWEREAGRFAPALKVYLHHGADRVRSPESFANIVAESDLVITTYHLAYRDQELLAAVHWGRIALDEAQHIKNAASKQSKAIQRVSLHNLARPNSRLFGRVALTGTPLENSLDELWSILQFLNPGLVGTLSEFRSRFSRPIEQHQNTSIAAELRALVSPFILRRLKSDPDVAAELPEKIEMTELVGLSPEQIELYESVLEEWLPLIDKSQGLHRRGFVLATITRLKQICDHPALYLGESGPLEARSEKLSRMTQLVDEMRKEGDRILIFSQYVTMASLISEHLKRVLNEDVLLFHGGLSAEARKNIVTTFEKPEGPGVLVLSLRAGGTGLNLSAANQVLHYDQWWNPAVQNQATDRAHRIGQRKNVQVRSLICRGTLEERIQAMLAYKQDLADRIVPATKRAVTELTTEDLRRLLVLSPGLATSSSMEEG